MLHWSAYEKPYNLNYSSDLPQLPLSSLILHWLLQKPQGYNLICGGYLPCSQYKKSFLTPSVPLKIIKGKWLWSRTSLWYYRLGILPTRIGDIFVCDSAIPENILNIGVLSGQTLQTLISDAISGLECWEEKFHCPNCQTIWTAWGHKEIEESIQELHQVGIVCSAHRAFNSPVWTHKRQMAHGRWPGITEN